MAENKSAGGRPTKYRREFAEQLLEWFRVVSWTTGKDEGGRPFYHANMMPTFEGFADSLGVDPDTLLEWCKRHKEFSGAYTRARGLQKQWILQNATVGATPSNIAVFLLKANHGMTDAVTDTDEGGDTVVNFILDGGARG